MYDTGYKQIEDVLAYLYENKQAKLALAVLDRERLLNEAWGKIAVYEKPAPTKEDNK